MHTINGGAGNDVFINFNATDTTKVAFVFNGEDGNDAAVGGRYSDIFNGGAGSDVFAMQTSRKVDGNTDKVVIADGDSVAGSHDVLYGFDIAGKVGKEAAIDINTAHNDTSKEGSDYLALAKAFSALTANTVNTKAYDGKDAGVFVAHHQTTNGLIEFFVNKSAAEKSNLNGTGGVHGIAETNVDANTVYSGDSINNFVNTADLNDALEYLAKFFNNSGKTVVFKYDRNGDGKYEAAEDSVLLFQDGAKDTVVELVGVAA